MNPLDQLEKDMKEHFDDSRVERDGDVLRWSSGSSTYLEIHSQGKVRTGMPLHQLEFCDVTEISFTNEGVKIEGDNLEYIFRK